MKVLLKMNPWAGSFDVWLVLDGYAGGERQVGQYIAVKGKPANLEFVPVAEGVEAQPTLTLPYQFADEIRKALDDHGPLTADNVGWVKDAIGTRDRLLTLVEKITDKS
jgi:hypothetical protein